MSSLRHRLGLPRRARGQSTLEYVLIIAACSVPLSYAIWYFFFHPRPGQSQGRFVEFINAIVDFVKY